ncbi:DsbA family protein [Vogesella indigofera]|uniref:DsbA family protein n=1 Tax=Vogesella indigofera TaxID=45465 RepID=UPI00234F5F94|nr:thioredoxin domain-containing protein [Vogesella indigofera]MDC7697627.1 thioredoxin domain-containing protein [Vogesella indigofera]
MKQKTLLIVAAVALLLSFLAAAVVYKNTQREQAEQQATANREALVRMHSPTLGDASAPVVLVEFFDPACETCRAFYPLVKDMMAANPGKIRLVLRYAPFHAGSDQLVAALEAARRQGKFWEAMEALLAAQDNLAQNHTVEKGRIWQHLEGLGLDQAKLTADMAAPDIANVIAQDLADAQTLKVSKTPEFYVNGRPLPSFGYEQLKALVDEEIAKAKS